MKNIKINIGFILIMSMKIINEIHDYSIRLYEKYPSQCNMHPYKYFNQGPNSHNQTKDGIYIVDCSYGRPSRIHTPIGEIMLNGSTSSSNRNEYNKLLQDFLNNYDCVMIEEEKFSEFSGHIGPKYLLRSISENYEDCKCIYDNYKKEGYRYEECQKLFKL